jgi:hypothetical protein
MIRCLIDGPSFERFETPHSDLGALADAIESICELVRDEQLLILPDDFKIVITCNPKYVSWDSPGQHWAADNTVYLSGMYSLKDLIKFLCHELIHVEQTTIGWLTYDPKIHALCWFGHPIQFDNDPPDDEYRNYPWERDAYRRESEVYRAVRKILDQAIMEAIWPSAMGETKSDVIESKSQILSERISSTVH